MMRAPSRLASHQECAGECGLFEVGALELRAHQAGAVQPRHLKMDAFQAGVLQVRVDEIGPLQVSAGEDGSSQVDFSQVETVALAVVIQNPVADHGGHSLEVCPKPWRRRGHLRQRRV